MHSARHGLNSSQYCVKLCNIHFIAFILYVQAKQNTVKSKLTAYRTIEIFTVRDRTDENNEF
jgi:hypothetical protein